jgi:hypothetical protein
MADCQVQVLVTPTGTVEAQVGLTPVEVVLESPITEVTLESLVTEVFVETVETIVVEVSTVPPSIGFLPRVRQPLTGATDSVNTIFASPLKFIHDGVRDETLYYNGVAQDEGVGDDYVASESGGLGTGFDTITTIFVPKPGDKLWLTFYQA